MKTTILTSLVTLALLSGCSTPPDCNSPEVQSELKKSFSNVDKMFYDTFNMNDLVTGINVKLTSEVWDNIRNINLVKLGKGKDNYMWFEPKEDFKSEYKFSQVGDSVKVDDTTNMCKGILVTNMNYTAIVTDTGSLKAAVDGYEDAQQSLFTLNNYKGIITGFLATHPDVKSNVLISDDKLNVNINTSNSAEIKFTVKRNEDKTLTVSLMN